jgi:aminopeptidase N
MSSVGLLNPTPDDFFRTMENVAGEDLSWFWRLV